MMRCGARAAEFGAFKISYTILKRISGRATPLPHYYMLVHVPCFCGQCLPRPPFWQPTSGIPKASVGDIHCPQIIKINMNQ